MWVVSSISLVSPITRKSTVTKLTCTFFHVICIAHVSRCPFPHLHSHSYYLRLHCLGELELEHARVLINESSALQMSDFKLTTSSSYDDCQYAFSRHNYARPAVPSPTHRWICPYHPLAFRPHASLRGCRYRRCLCRNILLW